MLQEYWASTVIFIGILPQCTDNGSLDNRDRTVLSYALLS